MPRRSCCTCYPPRRAPADEFVAWPEMRGVDLPEGGDLPLVLPPAGYAFDFVLAHSTPEDEPELVSGLYSYAELVIQQVSPDCISLGLSQGQSKFLGCEHNPQHTLRQLA